MPQLLVPDAMNSGAGARGFGWALILLAACMMTQTAPCQAIRIPSRSARPRPRLLCVACSLTITATPAAVTFSLVKSGTANASAPVVITTVMGGVTLLSTLNLYGYFSSASSALTDGRATPDLIATSAVFGQMTTGSPTTYTAFTQSNTLGPAGAGLLLYSTTALSTSGCAALTGCRTDSLNLQINLSARPTLSAGTFTGTLILQAQAL